MAADSGAQGGNARSVESKFDQYLSAQNSLKTVRLAMLLLFVAVALFSVYRMLAPIIELAKEDKQKEILGYLQTDLDKRVVPALTAEGKELWEKDLLPFLKEEADQRLKTQVKDLESEIRGEVESLLTDLEGSLRQMIVSHSENFSTRMMDRFVKEFPELEDENTASAIMDNLEKAANNAGHRVMQDHLSVHSQAIQGIALALESVTVPVDVQQMSNDELFEHAVALLMDLIGMKFDIERQLSVGADAHSNADTIPAASGQL